MERSGDRLGWRRRRPLGYDGNRGCLSRPERNPFLTNDEEPSAQTDVSDADLEVFRQASCNTRAFMDLRFKHFGTYVLMSIALAGAGLKVEALHGDELLVSLGGAALTVLFWLLDRRTGDYLAAHAKQAALYARRLGGTPATSDSTHIHSSTITAILFSIMTLAWLVAVVRAIAS